MHIEAQVLSDSRKRVRKTGLEMPRWFRRARTNDDLWGTIGGREQLPALSIGTVRFSPRDLPLPIRSWEELPVLGA